MYFKTSIYSSEKNVAIIINGKPVLFAISEDKYKH